MRWNSQDMQADQAQAGHALEQGTAEQPQRSNAPRFYIFEAKWPTDSRLTEVIRPRTLFLETQPKIPGIGAPFFCIQLKNKACWYLAGSLLSNAAEVGLRKSKSVGRIPMLAIHVEHLGDLTVVECKGRIIRSDSVFKLRDVVRAQIDARILALDLSAVEAIGGGGLGMLALLERWAQDRTIQFKLFNPSDPVVEGLINNRSILDFDIATFHEMVGILARSDARYAVAA
jgi:anti-anti-sigma regulatory factor